MYQLFLLMLLSASAFAQVFSESARTEFFGGIGFRIFYGQINKTQFFVDGNKRDDPNAPEVFVNAVPAALVYGVSPGLSLIGVFPMLRRTLKRTIIRRTAERTINSVPLSDTDVGIGDIIFFAKYRLFKKTAFLRSRQLSLQAGIKLPTGADDLRDELGIRLPAPLQLGSGSVDYRLALTFTEARNRLQFFGDAGYTLKTSANNFEFGDVFNYDATVRYRIFPAKYGADFPTHDLFLFMEINGVFAQKAKSSGIKLTNSGGNQIFIAPGFQFLLLNNLVVEAGIQLPVFQDLNGAQLGTDFAFRSGLRWILLP